MDGREINFPILCCAVISCTLLSLSQNTQPSNFLLYKSTVEYEICYCSFSLSDFHATEIFGYATRLSEVDACYLSQSLEFQKRRIQYAQLIADFGGFVNDAFRYCLEIASYIRGNKHLLSAQELTDFCDLADRLKYAACASVDEMSSIRSLRTMEQERKLTLQSCEVESGTCSASATPLPKSSPSQRFMTELDMAETSGKQMQTQTPLCPGSSTPSPVVNSLLPEEDVVSQQSDVGA
ncbi:unnamed protein product [Cylicostephanus goldi]|uniref:Sec16 Sec23-binding domain-containing protein n=1 Tax=Cylicostephanus goldi TaxID=71465 RepID=A0A3P6T1S2_CYLGO|nr:unnamed protein product [Cylicostephanus goldi]